MQGVVSWFHDSVWGNNSRIVKPRMGYNGCIRGWNLPVVDRTLWIKSCDFESWQDPPCVCARLHKLRIGHSSSCGYCIWVSTDDVHCYGCTEVSHWVWKRAFYLKLEWLNNRSGHQVKNCLRLSSCWCQFCCSCPCSSVCFDNCVCLHCAISKGWNRIDECICTGECVSNKFCRRCV